MVNLLEAKNLNLGYGTSEIVRNVDFSIKKGEILGIVGESGSGKSTLLKAIMQLPETGVSITQGDIYFNGKNLNDLTSQEKRSFRGSKIGVIFQNPGSSLNPLKKIKKQFIETIKSHKKLDSKTAYQLSVDTLIKLNFNEPERILESYPFELSGGMNQRVAIAIAMVLKPDLLLADEPTSALDVTIQAQVIDEMMMLRDKFETAIIIISHNMGVISKMADKIAVMYAGKIVEYGEKYNVIKNHHHPYTKALLGAIPKLDGKRPVGISGRPPTFKANECGCGFAGRCAYCGEQCKLESKNLFMVADNHWTSCVNANGA